MGKTRCIKGQDEPGEDSTACFKRRSNAAFKRGGEKWGNRGGMASEEGTIRIWKATEEQGRDGSEMLVGEWQECAQTRNKALVEI